MILPRSAVAHAARSHTHKPRHRPIAVMEHPKPRAPRTQRLRMPAIPSARSVRAAETIRRQYATNWAAKLDVQGGIVKALCAVLCVIGAFALLGCGATTATTSETQTSSAESQSTEATDTESTPVPPSSSTEGEDNESEGESQSEPEEDEPGSTSHAGDEKFCEEHECEGAFDTEPGAVVECSDGTWSHAGGISGACSHHGGEA